MAVEGGAVRVRLFPDAPLTRADIPELVKAMAEALKSNSTEASTSVPMEGEEHKYQQQWQQGGQHLQHEEAAPEDDVYGTKMAFDDAFIESKGTTETIDCWKAILRLVYSISLKCTYNVIMFLCGICAVTWWGIIYSLTAWVKIWCINPMFFVMIVCMKGCLPIVLEPISMFRKVCCGRKKGGASGI